MQSQIFCKSMNMGSLTFEKNNIRKEAALLKFGYLLLLAVVPN